MKRCDSCKKDFEHLVHISDHPNYHDGSYCESCVDNMNGDWADLKKHKNLLKTCIDEEKQLRGIALMTDNATATHILLVCDRLRAAAEANK